MNNLLKDESCSAFYRRFIAFIFFTCTLIFNGTLTALSPSILNISNPIVHSSDPTICVDTLGNVVCLWNQSVYPYENVVCAIKSVGQSSFSPLETISHFGLKITNLHSVSGALRDTIAIWQEFNGRYSVIKTARKSFGKEWSAPIALSPDHLNGYDPQISAGGGGEIVAVWRLFDGTNHVIQSSMLIFDSEWTPPVTISPIFSDSADPKIAINPAGLGIAVWQLDDEEGQARLQSSVLTTEGDWQAPENITGPQSKGTTIVQIQLGLSHSGEAIAAWVLDSGKGTSVIQISTKPLNRSWTSPFTLSNVEEKACDPQLVISRTGEVIVNWQVNMDGGVAIVQSRLRSFKGNWEPIVSLSKPDGAIRDHQIALTSSGDAVAIWSFKISGEKSIIQYAIKKGSGNWSSPLNLSNGELNSNFPQLAIDSFHRISAVWQSESHNIPSLIQFADCINLDTSQPVPPPPPPPPKITKPLPPKEFKGKVLCYMQEKKKRYMHILSWMESQDPSVVEYKIYKDNQRIGRVSSDAPLKFIIKDIKKNEKVEYRLVAVDTEGNKSDDISLELKPLGKFFY